MIASVLFSKKVVVSFLLAFSLSAAGEQVNVAVASNFSAPMKLIAQGFEKNTGNNVRVSFGSSGKLFAQIKQGAPFDIFLSADQIKPKVLEELRLAVSGSRHTYARGKLVMWSANSSLIDGSEKAILGQKQKKIALANPKFAPYGEAAVQVMKKLGVFETLSTSLVFGENIAQTYQFVMSGNAGLGFVAHSQLIETGSIKTGSFWEIPREYYSPIRQDLVLLKKGENKSAARLFIEYMVSNEARNIIHSFGYSLE